MQMARTVIAGTSHEPSVKAKPTGDLGIPLRFEIQKLMLKKPDGLVPETDAATGASNKVSALPPLCAVPFTVLR